MILTLLAGTVWAQAAPPLKGELHGELSSFFFGTMPKEHAILAPDGASGMGSVNGRLKSRLDFGSHVKLTMHPVLSSSTGKTTWVQTGMGAQAPEAVDLSWHPDLDGSLDVRARMDWLHLRAKTEGLEITIGRQPIGFGTGMFFTPMDLVSPYGLTTVDTAHRPGVDAVRVDGFFGTSGRLTGVAAYRGDWGLDGMIYLTEGQLTLGVTDLHALAGEVHGEPVVGLGAASSVGPVGLHSDVTLTLAKEEDAFVRAVVGADWRPVEKTHLSAEVYVQTLGATDPDEYLVVALGDRFSRGELQQMGRTYLGVMIQQELGPLVQGGLATFANLEDSSALLSPTLTCSVADNAELMTGAFIGLGARAKDVDPMGLVDPVSSQPLPDEETARRLGVQSEFGLVAPTFFVQMKSTF
jgi:hypothetical protein